MARFSSGPGRHVHASRRLRGFSLPELIIFIAILGVGLAGIIGVMNYTTQHSADPLPQKQALAIAEAYLEEILAMPFTYCDPDDANAATAQSTAAANPVDPTRCASVIEAMGQEGETRGSGTTPYDNVNDYSSLAAGVPMNVDGTPIGGLGAYTVAVAVATEALTANTGTVAATDANARPLSLRVTVTVTGPGATVRLDGYRTRYAPNALP